MTASTSTAMEPPAPQGHPAASSVPPPVRRITEELLCAVPGRHRAVVTAAEPGVVAGLGLLRADAVGSPAGTWIPLRDDGDHVDAGEPILAVEGTASELAVAEDHVLGPLGTAGGIARRALALRAQAPKGLRLACGGWKKLPAAMKPVLRAGLEVAAVTPRLVDGEFVYIDKNTVTLLGGVASAVRAGLALDHGPVAVQVVGVDETMAAVKAGCRIVMVDTGSLTDLVAVHDTLSLFGVRLELTLAFAGGVSAETLQAAHRAGADVVDVGRAIIDAPLWDLRLEVEV